ncbi:MAG: ATP phosphoribosyltransferase [Nitrosopumilus sp. H8]|nr:MAG: ATP phosphoribosyltransferase [Nitrosopumilus sp. H13]RNJ78110.1 MAG: ATP phosphoribosyltransferase [Nitrosopumilus sp. H8]
MSEVKFAIPKGSLEEATFRLLERSWTKVNRKSRTYRVYLDDPKIIVKMLRPQEIPMLVAEGLYDVGITGRDWVGETGSDAEPILDLEYGKIRLVVAFPDKYRYKGLDEMIADYAKKKKTLRISSEYLTTASDFIKKSKSYKKYHGSRDPLVVTPWVRLGTNKKVQIHLSFGATEAKPPEDVDAIIDVTETGTTLKQNKLRIADEILTSSAHLIANRDSLRDAKKREKIFDIVTLLRGAVNGRKYLHIYLNVEEKNLKKLLSEMPSLKRPTLSPLSEPGWYGVNTVIKKTEFHKLIPKLRRIAQGLVVHEPRQILELEEIKRDEEN